ncbi:hypothetical protein [Sinomicrobium sp. M5D2P17]
MNSKLKKVIKIIASALFVIALAINVKVTLDDPFLSFSESAIAQQTSGSDSSGQKWKREETKCYKNGNYCGLAYGCYEGSATSCTPKNCNC